MRASASFQQLREYYLRYWFIAYGYDVVYLDVFIFLDQTPAPALASEIIERGLLAVGQLPTNLSNTFPPDLSPLFRFGRGELWEFETGPQSPAIATNPQKALVRTFRIRDVASEFFHPSSAIEKTVERAELLP